MQSNNNHRHISDFWTNANMMAEGVTSFVSDFYWLGTWFDTVSGFKANEFGLSWFGTAFGITVALLSTGGAVYAHRAINTIHQQVTYSNMEEELLNESLLEHTTIYQNVTTFQKVVLFGALIAHTGDIAGPIIFIVDLATHTSLPRYSRISIQCGATLFGGLGSIACVRTCANAIKTLNIIKARATSFRV